MADRFRFRQGLAVRTRAMLAGILATGFLVGCGSPAALAPAPTSETSIAGADGKLVFGYRTDAPPFSFEVPGDVTAFSGFTAELCNLVARELATEPETAGLPRSVVKVSAEDRFERLERGEIDVLCGAASITDDRRQRVAFSIPVLATGVAVALAGDPPDGLAALLSAPDLGQALVALMTANGGRVGFRRGTTTDDWLAKSPLASADGVTLVDFSDHRSGVRALASGDIDVYVGDLAILRGLQRNELPTMRISGQTIQSETIALAMPLGAEELRVLVDRMLSRLYRSEAIVPIFERHFGPMTDVDRAFYRRAAQDR